MTANRGIRVRPITIMAGLGVAALLAAGFYAWGSGGGSGRPRTPKALPIAVSAAAGGTTAQPDIAMLPARPSRATIFVAAPGLAALGGSAPAWRLTSAKPDLDAVARLGVAFGLHGTPEPTPDGGWTMGPSDGPDLRVSATGAHSWSWSYAASATVTSPPIACARPLPATNAIGPDDSVASPPCGTPTLAAPVDVPDANTAERIARDLLRRAGIDVSAAKVTTSDGSSVTVTATPVLGDVAVEGLTTTVVVGSHGTVTYGSGSFGTPQRGDTYPLIGTRAAVAQLAKGELLGSGIVPMMGGASVPAASSASSTTYAHGFATATTTNAAPVTIAIDHAELVLSAQPGTDGALWLVPAYRLSARAIDGSWTVLAVDRRFVAAPVVRPPVATIEPPAQGSTEGSTGASGGSAGSGVATPATAPASTTSTASTASTVRPGG